MPQSKASPVVFIGSSTEGLPVAKPLAEKLGGMGFNVRSWTRVFKPGQFYLEVLRQQVEEADFAILAFTPDDFVKSREQKLMGPRDNVLFELGFFMGRLGRRRAFLLYEKGVKLKIPSDLDGLVFVSYDSPQKAGGLPDVTSACETIRDAIQDAPNRIQPTVASLSFNVMIKEAEEILSSLRASEDQLLNEIEADGDGERLLRGLRDGLLFIARAVVTGYVDPVFFGNLMEYDAGKRVLAHAHSCGPYNEEIITRRWSVVSIRGQGVAAKAFVDGQIQVRNNMQSESKAAGEQRLKAMMSVPVEPKETCPDGAIAALNIDAARVDAFPETTSQEFKDLRIRVEQLVELLRISNRLRHGQ